MGVKKLPGKRLEVIIAVLLLITSLVLIVPAQNLFAASAKATKTIVDMAGRTVTVSKTVTKVFGTGANATVYLYTLAPNKLIGTNYEFNSAEKAFIPKKYQNLPVFGNFSGSKTSTNLEALIKAGPDVLVMAASPIGQNDKEDADKLQKQTGIPVFIIDGSLEKIPNAYLKLGELLGEGARAKKLYSYSFHAINGVKYRAIPKDKQLTIFFGNGEKSLDTAPRGSSHGEAFDLVKAINAADLKNSAPGRIEVGLEQVISWNPQVIFVNGEPKKDISAGSARDNILKDKNWSTIRAVKDKKVYAVPKAPYAWVDRPSGPNRLIGLKWLGKTLYPEYYKNFTMNQEIKLFYSLFYHMNLTDAQVRVLLGE